MEVIGQSDYILTCLKQILQTIDIVLDIVNGYGLLKISTYPGDQFMTFGGVTLGLAWAPAILYFFIFISLCPLTHGSKRLINIIMLFVSLILTPLVPIISGLLMFVHRTPEARNLAILCALVEAGIEASLQVVWQGYILNTDQINTNSSISFQDPYGLNKLELSQRHVSCISLTSSILVLVYSSLICFVRSIGDLFNCTNKIGLILLIVTAQAFRTLSIIIIIAYTHQFSIPIFVVILFTNFYILNNSELFQKENDVNYLLLILNTFLNVPMICFFNRNIKPSPLPPPFDPSPPTYESIELNVDLQVPQVDLQLPQGEQDEDKEQFETKNVEQEMVKRTNTILIISLIIITALLNLNVITPHTDFILTKHGKLDLFNKVISFVIIPLGILSTLTSTSIKEGGLNKVKVFLTFCVGSVAYASAFILLKYMDSNDNNFFQCTLSIFVPNFGPFNFANLTFSQPEDVAKFFGNASMWTTLAGSMPVFLLLTFGVFGILALILMFSTFKNQNSCCSLFRFIFFILLCLILPVVVWSAILVFSLDFPQDEINPQNYKNFWSQNKVNEKLICDPSFWESTFYVTIASLGISFILILATIVAFFKGLVKCCER